MWIEKKEKDYYLDSSNYRGIRLKFLEGVTDYEKEFCKKFCYWLSKKYFFPIRCNIVFVSQPKFQSPDDGHFYYGVFYSNDELKPKRYPCVCVATRLVTEKDKYDCLYCIAHELTHYYQWYFYENDKKTNRSLEITAGKWGRYIVEEYEFCCGL